MRYGLVARLRPLAAALVVVGVSLSVFAGAASAETYNANSTAQLEEAVSKANANVGANTIALKGGVEYLPEKALKFTNTSGLQTVEAPSGSPAVKGQTALLVGTSLAEPFTELIILEPKVAVTFKNVEITHGGGSGGVPAIADSGTLGIENSTVAGNTGPGIVVATEAAVTVRNSTLSDGLEFGLIDNGTASFFNSTVAFNKNGGIENRGTLSLTNTIVAQNKGSGDCVGAATTSDHSLDSDGSCGVGALSKMNPLLQTSLANDGGSTPLHSLKPGSPAIDAGNTATCLTTDQRGAARPDVPSTPCDIGADEYNQSPPTIKVPGEIHVETSNPEGAVVTYSAEATSSDDLVRSFSCTPSSGATFSLGTTTVKCIATDGHESTATASFKVKVSCTSGGFCTSFTHLEPTEAPFGEPSAVAVDPSGNIWVADSAHDHILEFNSKREFIRQVGKEGSGEGQFKGIGGIATDSSGNLYATDSGNNRVEEFSSTGTFLKAFGSSAPGKGQLVSPGPVALDASGNVWVLNGFFGSAEGGRIVEFSPTGEAISQFGSKGSGPGQLLIAGGLAISGGNIYVSELSPARVQEFSTTGGFIRQFDTLGSPYGAPGTQETPYGIATDPTTGNLFVTELGDRVQEFSPTGSFVATFGSPGSGNGQFSEPRAVAVSSAGVIYVVDAQNKRLEVWAP